MRCCWIIQPSNTRLSMFPASLSCSCLSMHFTWSLAWMRHMASAAAEGIVMAAFRAIRLSDLLSA